MSGVRKDFCAVVSSGAGGSSRPRKNGISGCMPAVVSSVERSSARGTRGQDCRRRCPFDSKKERNPSLSSTMVRIATGLYEADFWRNPVRHTRVPRTYDRLGEEAGRTFSWRLPRRGLPDRSPAAGSVPRNLFTDLLERAPDQTRDVHLRDPHLLCDLRLRQALEKPEMENLPLAIVKRLESRRGHRAILRHLVLVLFRADRFERIELILLVVSAPGRERDGCVGATAFERLENSLFLDVRRLRDLGNRRRAAELNGELLEPVDRLDQSDRSDLDEVVQLLSSVGVSARQGTHERHVALDQLFAGRAVALFVIPTQERPVVDRGHSGSTFRSTTQVPSSRVST